MCGPDPLSRAVRKEDPLANALGMQSFNNAVADAGDPLGATFRRKADPVQKDLNQRQANKALTIKMAQDAQPRNYANGLLIK